MGFRQFFQRTRSTDDTPQAMPAPAVDLTDSAPQPDQMASLHHRPSKESVRALLDAEDLVSFNWFEDRYQYEYEAGIQKVGSGWRVYYADEKAGALFDEEYADEAEALSKFLEITRHNSEIVKERRARSHDSYLQQLRAAGHDV
jgi:hypothetical protein